MLLDDCVHFYVSLGIYIAQDSITKCSMIDENDLRVILDTSDSVLSQRYFRVVWLVLALLKTEEIAFSKDSILDRCSGFVLNYFRLLF